MEEQKWDHNPTGIAVDASHAPLLNNSTLLKDQVQDDILGKDTLNQLFSIDTDTLIEPEQIRVLEAQATAVELIYNLTAQPSSQILALWKLKDEVQWTKEQLAPYGSTAIQLLENRHFTAHLWNNNEGFFRKYFNLPIDRTKDDADLSQRELLEKTISKYVKDLSKQFALADPETGDLSQEWKDYLIEG